MAYNVTKFLQEMAGDSMRISLVVLAEPSLNVNGWVNVGFHRDDGAPGFGGDDIDQGSWQELVNEPQTVLVQVRQNRVLVDMMLRLVDHAVVLVDLDHDAIAASGISGQKVIVDGSVIKMCAIQAGKQILEKSAV